MGRKEALAILNSTKVGFNIYNRFFEFGYPDALASWFDTICYQLENSDRGSRFPLLKKLYDDEHDGVLYEELDAFKLEVETVQNELSKLPISNAIWDIDNPKEKIPVNHPNLNYSAKNLAEFYAKDSDRYGFFDSVLETMEFKKSNCFLLKTSESFTYDKSRMIVDGERVE
jgi:2,3-bisphosphoglycerate-dependent phosphoglycerate mutase